MNSTPASPDDSDAPPWRQTAVTLAYRFLCGLLMVAALALLVGYLFLRPIELGPIRLAQFFVLG